MIYRKCKKIKKKYRKMQLSKIIKNLIFYKKITNTNNLFPSGID